MQITKNKFHCDPDGKELWNAQEMSTGDDGMVGYDEYYSWWNMRQKFDQMDLDNSNTLDKPEMVKMAEGLGIVEAWRDDIGPARPAVPTVSPCAARVARKRRHTELNVEALQSARAGGWGCNGSFGRYGNGVCSCGRRERLIGPLQRRPCGNVTGTGT